MALSDSLAASTNKSWQCESASISGLNFSSNSQTSPEFPLESSRSPVVSVVAASESMEKIQRLLRCPIVVRDFIVRMVHASRCIFSTGVAISLFFIALHEESVLL